MAGFAIAHPQVGASVPVARLYGESCWHCGVVAPDLSVIGQVASRIEGGFRIWPVVGCTAHRSLPQAGCGDVQSFVFSIDRPPCDSDLASVPWLRTCGGAA